MKAYVIMQNDRPVHVVIGDEMLADVKRQELKAAWEQKNPHWDGFVHWYYDEVPCTHNPDWRPKV